MDEKINFQFDSICDAGQKGWTMSKFTAEEIKQLESLREQILEIKQAQSQRNSSTDGQGL